MTDLRKIYTTKDSLIKHGIARGHQTASNIFDESFTLSNMFDDPVHLQRIFDSVNLPLVAL